MAFYQLPKIVGTDKKPPFGARINRHHSLSQGLIGAWLFNEGGGSNAYNLVNGKAGVFSGTTKPSWTSLGVSNSNGYINMLISDPGGTPITMFSKFILTGSGEQYLIGDNNGKNLLGLDSTSWYAFVKSRWDNFVSYAVVPTKNVETTLSASGNASGCSLYLNGKKVASNGNDGTIVSRTTVVLGAVATTGSNPFVGTMICSYIYNRYLTDVEHASLYANPYQMIWPPVMNYYFTGEAAPPPTGGKSIFGYDSIFHAGGIIQT